MYNDCVFNFVCLNNCKGLSKMSKISLPAVVANSDVTIEFNIWSEEGCWYIDFDTLEVWYLAPTIKPEERRWVNIVDCMSEEQLKDIETQAHNQHDIVVSQLHEEGAFP